MITFIILHPNYFALLSQPIRLKNVELTLMCPNVILMLYCVCKTMKSGHKQQRSPKIEEAFMAATHKTHGIIASLWIIYGWICVSIFTIAKCCSISGISMAAEAGIRSIQGFTCRKFVTGITYVREAAWVHQTREPCCVDARDTVSGLNFSTTLIFHSS